MQPEVEQYGTYLGKCVKLGTDRVYAASDADGVMEDCVTSVDFI